MRARGFLARLRKTELGGLTGDSLWMTVWLGSVSVADLIQIALVTHALGLAEFGRLALVMSFVVVVGQFFDVRVGTAETTFGASRIVAQDWAGAAGVLRFGYAIDTATGALAFIIVAAAAPFVGPLLVGDGTVLVLLFALTLLASTVDDSSATVLRLMGRFRLLATTMASLELFRVAVVALALLVDRSLTAVLVALVVYDLAGAVVGLFMASRVFRASSGRSLIAAGGSAFVDQRAMLRTIFHTNVVSYARIAQVQLPTLLLGLLTTTTQVGLYKVGAAAGSSIGRIADPVYASTLPRLSRLWAEGRRRDVSRLLRQSTPIAAVILGGALLLLILFATPLLRLIGGPEATAAKPVLVLVGIGYAVSGIMFWNIVLLFAAGASRVVSFVAVGSAIFQIGLVVPLATAWDATGAALALSASLVVSNLVASYLALRALHEAPTAPPPMESITSDQRVTASSFE